MTCELHLVAEGRKAQKYNLSLQKKSGCSNYTYSACFSFGKNTCHL